MKVTKVDKIRLAVSGEVENEKRRGILYPTPNEKTTILSVEEQIKKRVKNANNLYNLFFRSDIPDKLKNHFCELVQIAEKSEDKKTFIANALKYNGYSGRNKKGEVYEEDICKFVYAPAGKNMSKTMLIYARERLIDEWQREDYRYAAVAVLLCICDKKYEEKISHVDDEVMAKFWEASRNYPEPFIRKKTDDLENCFTELMKMTAKTKGINEKIESLKNKQSVILNKNRKNEKKISLNDLRYEYATEDRMQAILVRMRKSIKRDTNGEIAVMLLQGLAQMNGNNLCKVLDKIQNDFKKKEALEKFLQAVEKDYYKDGIVKSIKNQDVKIQVQEDCLELSGKNIKKVSEKKQYKMALSDTLERYASSKEASDQVLLDIKEVLFDFFLWKDTESKKMFLTVECLWKIPNYKEVYFDTGFISEEGNGKEEAKTNLAYMLNQDKVMRKEIKQRINYVNCGKYQQLLKEETNDFRKYWITFAKDYVEKHYVEKKRSRKKENCYSTSMLLECWKDAIRFLCGKYIDLGKAIYHFAMPQEMSLEIHSSYGVLDEKYQKGISSFAYETIKAEENIQRDIANAVVSAASAFSRSAMNEKKLAEGKKKEDPMFLKEDEFSNYMKTPETAKKMLLRFYGGYSTIGNEEEMDGIILAKEILSHLKAIRNENFHFTDGKKVTLNTKYTEKLWKNEKEVYQQVIKEKYYFNNVSRFYPIGEIQGLVKKLYKGAILSEAQIPAFRSVWKRKDLSDYLSRSLEENNEIRNWEKDDERNVVLQGALYFLLKEIYYRDFILSKEAAKNFFIEVEKYKEEAIKEAEKNPTAENKRIENAGKSFSSFVGKIKKGYDKNEFTFGTVCQLIVAEYNQQNRSEQEEEIYKHFKLLLPLCIRRAFQQYIKDKEEYNFLNNPKETEIEEKEKYYLENVPVWCMEPDKEQAHWFTFAHFIHPKQLNFLVGNFKDYIQYKQDVLRRSAYAGQSQDKNEWEAVNQDIAKVQSILNVLEFVRHISGRVSNEFYDYYEDEEAYAGYLSQYIDFQIKEDKTIFESLKDFCRETLPNGERIDIYADEVNPKVLRNVEIARMYAGGDLVLPGYEKIKKEDLIEYYKNRKEVAQIQAKGICESEVDQRKVIMFQQLKGRITLNEVTDLFCMLNDLLGELVSKSYLRERDEMYLFLGFYYMALRNKDGWNNEILDKIESGKYAVDKGLVLYQSVALFDFGTNLLCCDRKGKWCEESGGKWNKFIANHWDSYHSVIRLFQIMKQENEVRELRDYVDHFKYYVKYDKSILELYSEYYTKFFGYSTKLRKSVLFNLESIMKKYFVEVKLKILDKEAEEPDRKKVFFLELDQEKTKSMMFTYKYKEKEEIKTLQLPAKSQSFMEMIPVLLQYKR